MKTTIKNISRWIHYFSSSGTTTRAWVHQILAEERETNVNYRDVMSNLRIGGWSHAYYYNGNFRIENAKHAHEVLRKEVIQLADELDKRLHDLTAVENELLGMTRDDSSSNVEARHVPATQLETTT